MNQFLETQMNNRSGGCRQGIPRYVWFRLPVGIHNGFFSSWVSSLLCSRLENSATHYQRTDVRFCRLLLVKENSVDDPGNMCGLNT